MTLLTTRPAPAEPETAEAPAAPARTGLNLSTLGKPASRPLIAAGAMLAASIAADNIDVPLISEPFWGIPVWAGAGALAVAATRSYTRRKHLKFSKLTRPICFGCAGWMAAATTLDWEVFGTPTAVALGTLAVAAAAGWAAVARQPRWLWDRLAPKPQAVVLAQPSEPELTPYQLFCREIIKNWHEAFDGGKLADTELVDIKPVGKGYGWRATVLLDKSKTATAEQVESPAAAIALAKVWRVGPTAVQMEIDPENASQAFVMVLRRNPLAAALTWDGTGISPDGRAVIGTYISGIPATYRFYTDTGPLHDLISGCTGSGKSEAVNLLLSMEVMHRDAGGHPLIASYVLDPQRGQSYAELLDAVTGYEFDIDKMAELLTRIEAEMYRRNDKLSGTYWTDYSRDPNGRKRKGVKTWQPTAEMPMISITIDECQVVLANPVCRDIVMRLLNMGRKCGIRLRLVTQLPVLDSLGNKSALADAAKSGNIIIMRAAGPITGIIAAPGKLGGQPHKLPPRYYIDPEGNPYLDADGKPDDKTAAGVCYLAGDGGRKEMARLFWPDDPFYRLFDEQDRPLYPAARVDLPELADALATVDKMPKAAASGEAEGQVCRDWLHEYMAERAGQVLTLTELRDAMGGRWQRRSLMLALEKLTEAGEIEKVDKGKYTCPAD